MIIIVFIALCVWGDFSSKFFNSSIASEIFVTLAIFMCSTAPADALFTVLFTDAALLFGIIIPCTPAVSAVLIIEPKLCGSSIPSNISMKAFSFLDFASFKISSDSINRSYY